MVKVSIIMPVYNDEEYLDKSINSVINQSLKDIELICIDDGSTDNSLKILKDLEIKYNFIKIISQENKGAGKARNAGLKIAKGEYIAFLDSDDIFIDSTALEKMYNYGIEEDAIMISANIKALNNGELIDHHIYKSKRGSYFSEKKLVKSDDYGIPWYFYKNIFKRSFLVENDIYFPDLRRGQDPIFLVKTLANIKEFAAVPIYLYGYNVSSGGGAGNKVNTYRKKLDYITHFKKTFDILEEADYTNILSIYKKSLFQYLSSYDNEKDKDYYDIVNDTFGGIEYFEDGFKEEYYLFLLNQFLNQINDINFKDIKEKVENLKIENYKFIPTDLFIFYKNILYSETFQEYDYINKLKKEHEELRLENKKLRKRNKKLNKKLKRLNKINKEIISSNSWKITKPLRSIGSLRGKNMTFTEKILQHSNSYNFYKRGYKKLTKKNKELTKKNKELTKKNKELTKKNKELTKVKFDSEVLLYDVTSEQIKDNAILMDSFFNNPHLELNKTMWFVPFFDHIFKGGIYTIFRTANYMSETYGTHNTFVFNGSPRKSMEELSKEIKETFPNLKFDVIYMVLFGEEKDLPETDAGFCTYWTTAYNLVKYNNCRAKFYFNQDYEPLFQSAGSVYGLIEETYRFNFIGIANTIGVKNKYESYGNLVKHFTPAVDRNIYFPPKDDSKDFKKYITFYGRPNNSRNGFILGIEALKIVKEYFGDKVEIFSVGAEFDLEEYDLNGVINNLGLLGSLDEVADLYRKCDIGLVFMFTPHPSYQPFEYMACGCATVTNINESNLWLLKDKENAILTEPVISCVADNIIKLLNNDDMRNRIVENGLKTVEKVNWDDELEKIIEFIKNPLDEIEENYKTIEKS